MVVELKDKCGQTRYCMYESIGLSVFNPLKIENDGA